MNELDINEIKVIELMRSDDYFCRLVLEMAVQRLIKEVESAAAFAEKGANDE